MTASKYPSPPVIACMPPILRRFCVLTILLTVVALATKYVCQHVLHLPEEYCFYFIPWHYRSVDFRCFIPRFKDFHHSTFFARDAVHGMMFTYPAPGAMVYQFFYLFRHGIRVYLFISASCAILAAAAFSKSLRRHGLSWRMAIFFMTTAVLTSYPLSFNSWLGNTEIVLSVLLGLGLYFFAIGRDWEAATFFALAASLKIYPLIFFALLLGRKRYRQIVFGIVLFAVVNVVSLWMLAGSVFAAQRGIQDGLTFYQNGYALAFLPHDVGVDHSLWALVKGSILLFKLHPPAFAAWANDLRLYMLVMVAAMLLLYFVRIRKLPLANQLLCLSIISVSFSPGSKDYTLMNLYVPWGLLVLVAVDAYRAGRSVPGLNAATTCFALLFVPLNEFIVNGVVLSGQLKAIILVVLLVIGLKCPFSERSLKTPPHSELTPAPWMPSGDEAIA